MASRFTLRNPLPLLILACVIAATSGSPGRLSRRVSSEEAIPKSVGFSNNEFTSEPRRRVSNMLMGGHMKLASKTDLPISRDKDYEDNSDEASWDDGLIISSAGNGKEKKTSRAEDDDEKKTLSQQVKEGKYGLIQNEIYPSRPKRPGIISYLSNPEVPKDNAKSLGGLDEEEIWLAENHVLVLRGGNFPDHEAESSNNSGGNRDDWSPIDDYKAPRRQVKIPSRPKVPPPFPVQLTDNGPVQIIGVNGSSDSSIGNENDPSYGKGFLPGEGPFFAVSRNSTPEPDDQAGQENSTRESSVQDRKTKSGRVPPPSGAIGPFYPALPPGAVFVAPPGNQSDYDEDDQSIYYPPPYSFTYKQDSSTAVPPGPLVPGIILPPPPDFFAGVEEKKSTSKVQHTKYPKRPTTTPLPRANGDHYPSRKSSGKPQKVASSTSGDIVSTTKQAPRATFTMKPVNRIKYKTTTGRSTLTPIRVKETHVPQVEVTTPGTVGASTLMVSDFYTEKTARPKNVVSQPSDSTTMRSKSRWTSSVSAKPVPLVSYYVSSTPSSILDEALEATPVSMDKLATTRRPPTTVNQASYYFYEEAGEEGTTPNPTIYYRATTEAPFYRAQERPKKPYYDAQATQTQRPPKDYGFELLEPVKKTSPRYRYPDSATSTQAAVSSRLQGQRMLGESSPLYYDSPTERPHTRGYYTTTKPNSFLGQSQEDDRYDYDQASKPKPIYQYSYEAADYYKRGQPQNSYYKPESQRQSYYKQDSQRPTEAPVPFDEWQDIRGDDRDQYDYDSEALPEQRIQPIRVNDDRYRNRQPTVNYPSSTSRPIIDVTPNPHHVYYTKQDEQLLDDVTKEYFTNFGKKLRGESLPSTTPIYAKSSVTERPDYQEVGSYVSNDYETAGREMPTHKSPRVNVHYGDQSDREPQRPVYSLEGDTQVNYKDPLPPVEPDSEWIPGFNPKERPNIQLANYRTQQTQLDNQGYVQRTIADQRLTPVRGYSGQHLVQQTNGSPTNFVPIDGSRDEPRRNYPTRPVSLAGDISINYRNPRPPINPEAEFIDTGSIGDGRAEKASYFAYRLPGDSGHFYFLTPQAISQRPDGNGGYLYPRPRGTRLSRQRRRGPGNA